MTAKIEYFKYDLSAMLYMNKASFKQIVASAIDSMTTMISLNKIAFFQIKVSSRFHYVLLCNL